MYTKLLVLNFREPQRRSDKEKPVPARIKPELVESRNSMKDIEQLDIY